MTITSPHQKNIHPTTKGLFRRAAAIVAVVASEVLPVVVLVVRTDAEVKVTVAFKLLALVSVVLVVVVVALPAPTPLLPALESDSVTLLLVSVVVVVAVAVQLSVKKTYSVPHPRPAQDWSQPLSTKTVGMALGQPQDCVSCCIRMHSGRTQVLQTVLVRVTVGQPICVAEGGLLVAVMSEYKVVASVETGTEVTLACERAGTVLWDEC